MSLPVLVGFAGVLVAAVATGMLAGRCVRQPRIEFVLWTAAALGLTIALAAQSMGFGSGFGPVTFRAVQLSALLLAPLWLAWGLVEFLAANEAARFGMRLISSALTVVASVILATDPLTAQPFSKSWPVSGTHFQPISHYALDVVQAFAVAAVLVSAGTAAARARSDPRWRAAMTAAVPVGLAVLITVALRLSLPARAAYPLLSMLAAALVWFGVSRVGEPPWQAARRDNRRAGRRDGVRDGRGGYRSGDRPDDDYWPDETYRPADDYGSDGQYATYGPRGGTPGTARPRGSGDLPGAGPAASSVNGRDMSSRDVSGRDVSGRDVSGRDVSGRDVSGRDVSGRDPGRRVNSGPQPPMPQWQDRHRASAPAGAGEAALAGAEFGPQAGTGGSPAASPARPYGRILIFTLLEDRVADFDRLAEQAAEEVRTGEPDTLVYVIHLVPNAPLQRIFYEIYRDRAAFESHESQPYMQRFVAERRTCVLATNVIELRLKYAKVAPLPNPQASAPVPPGLPAGPPATRAQSPPGPPPRPQPAPPGRPAGTRGLPVPAGPGASGLGASGLGASGPQPAQRLQPLPPVRPQRPDQRRPDQPRPDQPRPDQQRPDQRQVPSGRHYRG